MKKISNLLCHSYYLHTNASNIFLRLQVIELGRLGECVYVFQPQFACMPKITDLFKVVFIS